MKIPSQLTPIWRSIQIIRIGKGLDDGLRMFIVGPFFYDVFKKTAGEEHALFYTSLVWSIYCGMIALFEVPTGVWADIFGRVRIVTAHFFLNLIYGLALAGLIFFHTTTTVLVVAFFAFTARAIAFTLYSGSYIAWVVDSINEVMPSFGYERLLARGTSLALWFQIVGALLGLTLYMMGVAYVAFILGALICLCCAGYCMAEMKETKSLNFAELRHFWSFSFGRLPSTVRKGIAICKQSPVIWWVVITYSTFDFLYSVIGYLWPVVMTSYFGKGKLSLEWYAIVVFTRIAGASSSQLFAWYGDRIHHETGSKMSNPTLRRWMVGAGCAASIGIIGLGYSNWSGLMTFPLFFVAILLMCVASVMVDFTYEALVNNYIHHHDSQERATVLSIASMLGHLFMLILLVPSSGKTGETSPIGWILPASIALGVLLIGNFKIKLFERKSTEAPLLSPEVL